MAAGGIPYSHFKKANIESLKLADVDMTATAAQLNQAAGTATGYAARKVATLTLSGTTLAVPTVQAWQNPESGAILVERAVLDVTTQSTGACTLDIGRTTVSATTGADTLLDGISVAAAGVFDSTNDTDNGTNGVAKVQKLAAGGWVTVSEASGAAEGLVGTLYIYYTVA